MDTTMDKHVMLLYVLGLGKQEEMLNLQPKLLSYLHYKHSVSQSQTLNIYMKTGTLKM